MTTPSAPCAAPQAPRFWLLKSEPAKYSLDDLRRDGSTPWDGVRNFQARNFLRDGMRVGDRVLFYHSNAAPPAVVGIAEVVRAAYPDHTARDPHGAYYDPQATAEKPLWVMVDVGYVATFARPVSLATIKSDPQLSGIALAQKGSRLSVQPVSAEHFARVLVLGVCSPVAD